MWGSKLLSALGLAGPAMAPPSVNRSMCQSSPKKRNIARAERGTATNMSMCAALTALESDTPIRARDRRCHHIERRMAFGADVSKTLRWFVLPGGTMKAWRPWGNSCAWTRTAARRILEVAPSARHRISRFFGISREALAMRFELPSPHQPMSIA